MNQYNHYGMYEGASKEQLVSAMKECLEHIEKRDPELYEEIDEMVHEKLLGPHFDREEYERAAARITDRSGRRGPHWTTEQIADYARRNGDRFDRYNEYDLAYAMNSLYSDYYGTVPDNTDGWYRMAKQFLDDPDAPDGKAWRYYRSMRRHRR